MPPRQHEDDPGIRDSEALWRRIPRNPLGLPHVKYRVYDEKLGRERPTSIAFCDSADGSPMSVLLAEAVAKTGRGPSDVVTGRFEGYLVASIAAGLARSCVPRQGVARDPTEDEPVHAVVFGEKTRAVRNRLAKGSSWVIAPPK